MKTNWDLTVFYKDFDDPAFKADLGGLDASIAALTEAVAAPCEDEAAKLTASGLLRGARGNSGVILSLLFRGMSKVLKGHDTADGALLAEAMQEGVSTAYGAVMKPAGKARGWCCAAAALCCLLAVAGCLLWTPTHYDTLYGLQGRYFLPVLPLLLLTCLPRRLAAVPDEDTAQTRLVAALALVQAGMVVNIMLATIPTCLLCK